MKNISKKLHWQIIVFPILLIGVTYFILTIYQKTFMDEFLQEQTIQNEKEYIEQNKNKIKENVLKVEEDILFMLKKIDEKELKLSKEQVQKLILQRYTKHIVEDDYMFIYKLHKLKGGSNFATIILNQNRHDLVGRKISDIVRDINGKAYRKEFLEKIKKDGEAFVEYMYKKPNNGKIVKKISYFYHLKEWDWVIAQGFYFDTLEQKLTTLQDDIKQNIYDKIKVTVGITFALALIISLVSFLLSKRMLKMMSYYVQLIKENENKFVKKLEKFIDAQDNIVILANNNSLSFANKKFFTFLGYKNLEDFKKHHKSISELFIANNRFFHLGKVDNGNWIDYFKRLPHSERIVSMMSDDFSIHAFSVNINKYDETYDIISFANISQTMLEHIKLEEKTIHDKLTGAYNREYFDLNFRYFIQEYNKNESQLAIALLDIDYFKEVNDIHGHDVGDKVLIQFVQTIQKYSRDDDILIRWGGEEFILILKVKSKGDLFRALDHIRKVVEIEEFEVVEHKTCSIGGSIHQVGEPIEKTIKRADEGTYEAKASGRNNVIIL